MENDLKCTIKGVLIKDFQSSFYNQKVDILVDNGVIVKIASSLDESSDEVLDAEGMELWPGLCDFRVHFRDPGEEYKESLESGLEAALAGGVTSVGILSSTTPVVDSKSIVEYIKQKSDFSMVQAHPLGVVSERREGENLAELFDMWNSGASGFTDDLQTLSPSLLIRALEYVQNFKGLVIQNPNDKRIFPKGQIHEGIISTQNGLKGLPSLMEHTTVQQNIEIVKYTGGQLHFAGISTKESVALIKAAKNEGVKVTADVNAVNLLYTDEDVSGFDNNFKVSPPLRSEEDRLALIKGVKEGVIDVICSDHRPEDQENKMVEFENAAFGRIGTQTLFLELQRLEFSDEELQKALVVNPRNLLKEKCPVLQENEEINALLFHRNTDTPVDQTSQFSKSQNTNIWNTTLSGKVEGVIKGNKIVRF